MPEGHLDPYPPVSARSKAADVVPGRFASLPSAPQAQGGLLGSSHPRPRADPGNRASGGGALWVVGAQGSHRTPWCGQLGGLSSARSCLSLRPHHAASTRVPHHPPSPPRCPQHGPRPRLTRDSPRRPAILSHFFPSLVWQALGWNCLWDGPPHTKHQQKSCPLDKIGFF